ncbi:hypothetical protein HWV62_25502 [Athelia sp. TMB]|nr:hypothetical protein HWV62_25502 [Athelia sp. TMB]
MPYHMNYKDPSRRHRHHFLVKRLEELETARRELLLQLEELDAQKNAIQLEFNELQNVDAPISSLPDEVLGMIFETGVLLDDLPKSQFATLVSHVTHSWRSIALTTPRLWNTIFWDLGRQFLPEDAEIEEPLRVALSQNLQKAAEIASAFLSRSSSAPIDIYIRQLRLGELKHGGADLARMFELIHTHFDRCRYLCIQDANRWAVEKTAEKICCRPAPLLRSIDLGVNIIWDSEVEFVPSTSFLPSGTPRLNTAHLDWIKVSFIHRNLHAFRYLQSLRLVCIIDNENDHALLAKALNSMRALDYLELDLTEEVPDLPALTQSTIRFLCLRINQNHHGRATQCFQAVSLKTLAIECELSESEMGFDLDGSSQAGFPLLQHLVLIDVTINRLELGAFASRFPQIRRLTCQGYDPGFEMGHVLDAMGAGAIERNPASAAEVSLHWKKLHTIAVSGPNAALGVPESQSASQLNALQAASIPAPRLGVPDSQLNHLVATLQAAGIPIRRLMLPPAFITPADGEMMTGLRKLVEVEDFSLD